MLLDTVPERFEVELAGARALFAPTDWAPRTAAALLESLPVETIARHSTLCGDAVAFVCRSSAFKDLPARQEMPVTSMYRGFLAARTRPGEDKAEMWISYGLAEQRDHQGRGYVTPFAEVEGDGEALFRAASELIRTGERPITVRRVEKQQAPARRAGRRLRLEVADSVAIAELNDEAAPHASGILWASLPIDTALRKGKWSGQCCSLIVGGEHIRGLTENELPVCSVYPGTIVIRQGGACHIAYGPSEYRSPTGPEYATRVARIVEGGTEFLRTIARTHDEGDMRIRITPAT